MLRSSLLAAQLNLYVVQWLLTILISVLAEVKYNTDNKESLKTQKDKWKHIVF